jgi:hypothetical protein
MKSFLNNNKFYFNKINDLLIYLTLKQDFKLIIMRT